MAADIQHADAVKALEILEAMVLDQPRTTMTYGDLCERLGRDPAKSGRYIGQVTSRIDAACFYAKRPFLAAVKVRSTGTNEVNENSFAGMWEPHRAKLIRIAEVHVWTVEDFRKIRTNLLSLGDDGSQLLWERIESFGEKAVQQALAVDSAT